MWKVALTESTTTHVLRTFKFRLLPRKAQHKRLRAALDHTRELYNAALEERMSIYRKTGKGVGLFAQYRSLTELRADPSFTEFSVSLQRWPLQKLDFAFAAFFRRLKRGQKPGFPRFRGVDWFKSFGFNDVNGWRLTDSRLYMKGIGRVRLHMHRPIPSRPLLCQIKRESGGWFALLVCEVPSKTLADTGRRVGIDLGITSFIATSDGEIIPGFRVARRAQAKMRRQQRAFARCKRGSVNRRKAKARVAATHEKLARSRRTFHHQIASRIVRDNDVIAIENLNIKGLAASMLARDVSDAGWSSFTHILLEKAESAGRVVEKVDPRRTSQTCPDCGHVQPKTLSEREHRCSCGCIMDRDVAAAKVILSRAVMRPGALATSGVTEVSAEIAGQTAPLPRRRK